MSGQDSRAPGDGGAVRGGRFGPRRLAERATAQPRRVLWMWALLALFGLVATGALLGSALTDEGRSRTTPGPIRSRSNGHATIVPVVLADLTSDSVDKLVGVVQRADGRAGFAVHITGEHTAGWDFGKVSETDLRTGELQFGLPAALVVLLLVFGTVVGASIPLLMAMISIVVGLGLVAIVGHIFKLNLFVTNMLVAMGLALGIDYSLFIVSRLREERARGADQRTAILTVASTATRAVVFSGTAFTRAMVGMLIVPHTILRSLATGAIALLADGQHGGGHRVRRLITGAALIMIVVFPASQPASSCPSSRWASAWPWRCSLTPPSSGWSSSRRSWAARRAQRDLPRWLNWLPASRLKAPRLRRSTRQTTNIRTGHSPSLEFAYRRRIGRRSRLDGRVWRANLPSLTASAATCLFADIAGFTALTEAHGDEEAAALAADFCDAVKAELPATGATHVKSIGDALMLRVPEPGPASCSVSASLRS